MSRTNKILHIIPTGIARYVISGVLFMATAHLCLSQSQKGQTYFDSIVLNQYNVDPSVADTMEMDETEIIDKVFLEKNTVMHFMLLKKIVH